MNRLTLRDAVVISILSQKGLKFLLTRINEKKNKIRHNKKNRNIRREKTKGKKVRIQKTKLIHYMSKEPQIYFEGNIKYSFNMKQNQRKTIKITTIMEQ